MCIVFKVQYSVILMILFEEISSIRHAINEGWHILKKKLCDYVHLLPEDFHNRPQITHEATK